MLTLEVLTFRCQAVLTNDVTWTYVNLFESNPLKQRNFNIFSAKWQQFCLGIAVIICYIIPVLYRCNMDMFHILLSGDIFETRQHPKHYVKPYQHSQNWGWGSLSQYPPAHYFPTHCFPNCLMTTYILNITFIFVWFQRSSAEVTRFEWEGDRKNLTCDLWYDKKP